VTVEVANNFGSDSGTTIVGTSSGDTSYTLADSWVTTWDGSSEINTTAFATPGAVVTPDSYTQTVFNCAGPQGMGATFTLTVPAFATQSLVFFGGIAEIDGTGDTDTANAMANAMMFESLSTVDPSLTSDLSPAQVAQIVNYVGEPVLIEDVPVPTLSQWALLVLMVLMGLFGFGAFRRRA
ncbi:MAG: IPTL-CTERM sorting domain-containing protein, partial [Gammaproteobacteria bacterium]|nr:IPTL-CTERM sorting domain-containing protein [Gammaproteobacteria bacterium]